MQALDTKVGTWLPALATKFQRHFELFGTYIERCLPTLEALG
jgi:hypothetical protein